MANEKGGSDLDVFEGLTKKPASAKPSFPPPGPAPSRPTGPSGPPGPPPSMRERPKTMLGIAPPPVGLPPSMPSSGGPAPAGPPALNAKATAPMPRPSTLSSALPAPAPAAPGGPPGPPPSLRSGLPPVAPAPSRPPGPLPGVAGPPPAAATKPSSVVDMDWDDEDEKTNIYDKDETQQSLDKLSGAPLPAAGAKPNLGTAAALAAGSGGMAGPPPSSLPLPAPLPPPTSARMPTPPPGSMSLPSAARALTPPPGTLPMPTSARMPTPPPGSLPIAAQPSRFDGTQAVSKPAGGGKGGLIALLLAGVVVLGGGIYMMIPKTGNLVVSVKSKVDGRTVDKPSISINDKKICESSPCRADNLPKGVVVVKASAAGYDANDQTVSIRAGEDATLTLELFKSRDSVASTLPADVAPKTTGFKAAGPSHIKVSLDGKELGSLPQEVKDLAPGAHKVRFASSDLYLPDERSITLTEGKTEDLGTVKLKVVKGRATITLDTPGASVKLISGTDRRILPTLPIKVDIDTSKSWTIEATKPGYENLSLPISFDDGEAEKTFSVALLKKGEKPKVDSSKPDTTSGTPPATTTAKPDDTKPGPAVADTGMATLNIMSVPPANCVLDGRPLGQTPKPGVSVTAGSHTILFVHPEKGRKTQTVTVKGGETKPVIVKF